MFERKREQEIVIEKNIEEVHEAVIKAVQNIKWFKLKAEDRATHTIDINVSVSLFAWGERMTVVLTDLGENKTQVKASSRSKLGTEVVAGSRNEKNVAKLIEEINKVLS